MAAITVPIPGTEYLCDALCRHKDCAAHHRDAAAICHFCHKSIGYGNPWITLPGGQSAHFVCADQAAQNKSSSRKTKEKTMTKKKAAAPAKPAAPYYVNPHTKEPVDYANIIAYCRYSRSKPYWVRAQIEQAKAINAPQTTIRVSDGKASDFYEITNRDLALAIVEILERGVTAPPPEAPCKHCGEDTSDGFHRCEGAEQDDEGRAI